MSSNELGVFVKEYEVRDRMTTLKWLQKQQRGAVTEDAAGRCLDVSNFLLDVLADATQRESIEGTATISEALIAMYRLGQQEARS